MARIKILKLTQRIKERVGRILQSEINDPRLGFVTVTRIDLANDLKNCKIYYSVLGSEADQRTTERALEHARGYVQRKIAEILRTRVTPHVDFAYDQSVEGVVRVSKILNELAKERGEYEDAGAEEEEGEEDGDGDTTDDADGDTDGETEAPPGDVDSTEADSTEADSTDADSTDADSTDADSTDADSTNTGSRKNTR